MGITLTGSNKCGFSESISIFYCFTAWHDCRHYIESNFSVFVNFLGQFDGIVPLFRYFHLVIGFLLSKCLLLTYLILEIVDGGVIFIGEILDIVFPLLDLFLFGFPVSVRFHLVGVATRAVALIHGVPLLALLASIALGGCCILSQSMAVFHTIAQVLFQSLIVISHSALIILPLAIFVLEEVYIFACNRVFHAQVAIGQLRYILVAVIRIVGWMELSIVFRLWFRFLGLFFLFGTLGLHRWCAWTFGNRWWQFGSASTNDGVGNIACNLSTGAADESTHATAK